MKKCDNKNIIIMAIYFVMLVGLRFGKYIPNINIDNIFSVLLLGLIGFVSIYYVFVSEFVHLEYLAIVFLITLFWDMAIFSTSTDKSNIYVVMEGVIVLNLSFWGLVIKLIRRTGIVNICVYVKKCIVKFVKEKWYLIIIIAGFTIMSIDMLTASLFSDGYDYYSGMEWCRTFNFQSMNKLVLSGHNSQGYTFFALLGEFVYPNRIIATRIINLLLGVVTIWAIDIIVYRIFKDLNKIEHCLYVIIFAFSPIIFSMIAEINIDYALLCFMIWLICAYLCNNVIMESFCGLLVCFSKETGLLIYGFFIIGKFIINMIEYIRNYKNRSISEALAMMFNREFLMNCFGGVAWLSYYMYNNMSVGWNDVYASKEVVIENADKINTFVVNLKYMVFKLIQVCTMNYMWIFLVTIIVFLIFDLIVINKNKCTLKRNNIKLLPIILMGVATVIFNLFYITWTNYRYLIQWIFFVILLTLGVVYLSKVKRNIKLIVLSVLALVTFISNYSTDFVSENVFLKFKTNATYEMVVTPRFSADNGYVKMLDKKEMESWGWCDTMVYNKQYTYWGRVWDSMLNNIEYDEDTLILIPCVLSSDISMYSRYFGISQKCIPMMVWNKESNHIEYSKFQKEGAEIIKVNLEFVNEEYVINNQNYSNYKNIYYVELPGAVVKNNLRDIKIKGKSKYQFLTCGFEVDKIK